MKFSTSNAKCSSYSGKHVIYVGTHTGSFKKLEPFQDDPYRQTNLQPIETLDKTSKVTCMEFGNDEHTEILLGRANHYVKVFNSDSEVTASSFEAGNGEVVGLGRSNGCIVAGIDKGTVKIVKYPETTEFSVGENLAKLRICRGDQNLMVTGGKNLKQIIKVWDLETQKVTFAAKNVRKDMLELEQPVWENDILFLDRNTIASCSRYGYVRVYDLRGTQRRPVQNYSPPDDQLSFTCLAGHERYLYAGTTTVGTRAFDIRKMKNHVHVYKGFTGTVTSVGLDATGSYLFTSCLDRYVRVHNVLKTAMVYQCYVKSKPTRILCTEYKDRVVEAEEDDDLILVEENEKDEVDSEYEDLFAKMQTVKEKSATKKRKMESETHSRSKPKIPKKKRNNE
ncbi:WD repeat-containing protein 74 [Topomyia yanbarensis]|uniref:WD repeat-containing protein 74 n=1 Tax=Topomyia yanbarensis TaxID=2498891 RepID=UPI00273CCD34|nr:WD repeat-containing protein 74 [Topomyia yanbarensis]